MKKNYWFLLLALLCFSNAYSASVTPAQNRVCTQNYTGISNIVISESGNVGDFGTASATTGNYFFIVAPTGFEFDPNAGVNANFSGGGNAFGASVLFKTASVIAITYNCDNNAPAKNDVLTIQGISVKAQSISGTNGAITMGTGSLAIGGGPFANSTVLANVQSAITSISLNTSSPKCSNDGTYALNGNHSLSTGVSLNNATYSGSGVSGSGPNYNPSSVSAGSYVITYTVNTNSPGCSFSTTANIDINAAPVVTLTSTESSGLSANDNTTCDTEPITFYAYGANTYQFQRNGFNGIGASTVTPYVRTNLVTGDQMTVIGTALNGCSDVSNTITMTVNALPATVAFSPTVTTYSSSAPYFVLDTLDSPAPFAADPWNINSYFSGNGVVPGSGGNSGKDLFFPDVAASYGNPVSITYTYVDANGCKKAISTDFTVSGAVSTGSLNGLNSSYCINASPATFSISATKILFGGGSIFSSCFIGVYNFQNFEYYNPVTLSWIPIPAVLNGANYDGSFDPATVAANGGTGLRTVRAVFYSGSCGYEYFPEDVTINPLPTISIPNYTSIYYYNNGEYPCNTWGDSTLTFSASSLDVSITGFTTATPGFLYFNSGAYKLKWSVGAIYPTINNFTITIQDAVTTCTNTVPFQKYVFTAPGVPIVVPPKDKCVGDLVVLKDTVYTPSNVFTTVYSEWYKKNGGINTLVQTSYNYLAGYNVKKEDSYSLGVVSVNDTFFVKQYHISSCKSAFSSPIIVKVFTPPTVDAGVYPAVCNTGPNVTLAGVRNPGSLGITWTSSALPAATGFSNQFISNPTYSAKASEITAGTMKLYLTTDDPDGVVGVGCSAVKDSAIISINASPGINAGADASTCSNTNPTLTATLSNGATSLVWSRIGVGGVINTPTVASTTYTIPNTEKNGATVTFVATSNDPDGAGPCLSATDQVAITIYPEVQINGLLPITPITTCGSSNIPLSATCITYGGGNIGATWSKGIWSSGVINSDPKNASYVPTPTEAVAGGSYTFTLTSDDPTGPCLAQSATVTHTISPAPFVDAGLDATWCSNTNPSITAVRSGSALSVTWTKNTGSGTIASPTADATSYLVAPGDYALGTPFPIVFTATTNDPDLSGPCVPATDAVTITISPNLTVNAGPDVTVCANQNITLNGNVKIGGTNRNAPGVNRWKTFNGLGIFTQNSPNFSAVYHGQGDSATSGIVIPGYGELATITNLQAYLISDDPDGTGPTGPCLADSQSVNIRINPLPIPHFDPSTAIEYCLNTPAVKLRGNLGSIFSPTGSSANFSGGTYVTPSGTEFEFDPKKTSLAPIFGVNGGTYGIRYTFKDSLACQNYVDTTIQVFPYPSVDFSVSTRCQFDTITFVELANVNNSVYTSTTETDWDWKIDGDTIQNVFPNLTPATTVYSLNTQSTKYAFANYGIHSIKLVVTSNSTGGLSCYNTKDTTLIFGPYPNTDYSWTRPCSVDSVFYVNNTTIAPGYTNAISWNMNDLGAGSYKNSTSSTSQNPNYKFAQPGIYNVQLTATTNTYNCVKVKSKEVYVVPTYSITTTDPYDSSFATNLNWAPSGYQDQSYSWQHGTPSASKRVIKPGGGASAWPGNNVWVTNLTSDYKVGELSYLNSPCFDFSALDKPMIVMKQWANTTNLAGAVLEATTGNSNPWLTIGQIGTGINWYNTLGVVGLIGSSPTNPIAQGFSGELNDWSISRIGLSQYANNSNLVRFRLVFGSSNVNDALNQRDGFAIDSVWIGNRSKVVLLEHFTNSLSNACIEANDSVNSIQSQLPADVVSLHYHTSFPGTDNMNLKNPADPSSRVLYYGVTAAPRTQLDGIETYTQYGNTSSAISLTSINNKALENPKFTLDLSSKKVGLNLNVKAQLVAKEALSQDVVLNIAVLEKYVAGANVGGNQSGYQWVLKKMLPDAAGTYISKTWAIGDTVKTAENWDFTISDFYDTSQVEVVAFVQNFTSKEVYQAARVASSGNTSVPIITAVDVQDIAENLMVYPVPADNEINVLFGSDLLNDTEYSLNDDMGRVVEKGVVSRGVRMLSFNSKKLASGMYYLSLTKEDGSKLNKKIVVIH